MDPSSASDHYSNYSNDPQPAPSRPKKHSDKPKHTSRPRFLPSSLEEDQSPEHRHRSPKPSRKSYSDQDHPQHDPDPPYYREVALSDIPSQYAEEVDTFRRILKLPDPRESLPRSSTAVMGKISRVLQSPVSSAQASPKVEASNRPKQAQHFSTCRKVQDGNSRVHQDLPDSRGMSIIDRSIGRLPSHPHPSSLKEIPKILPQVSGVPVHPPTFRTGHSPPGLYHDRKGGETHGPLQRSQSREEALVNTQAVVDLTQSLGWIINQEKSELNPTQVFSFVGYEYHLDSALVKPTQERWFKLQDFILQLKSKHVLTARCLISLIGLLASMEKMVPEGRLHMRPFQFHLKEHWKFPQPLDSLLPWTEAIAAHLDWWQNPANVMRGSDLHPKDHSIQLLQTLQTKVGALT